MAFCAAATTHGKADGRLLLGDQLRQLYVTICEVLEVDSERATPLVFDDADQVLEQLIQKLHEDLTSGGRLLNAIDPMLRSFDAEQLAC